MPFHFALAIDSVVPPNSENRIDGCDAASYDERIIKFSLQDQSVYYSAVDASLRKFESKIRETSFNKASRGAWSDELISIEGFTHQSSYCLDDISAA